MGGRVYGRRYLRGPHGEDNEIQLLSLTAEGHEDLDSEEERGRRSASCKP